ncbi:MAG TPA: hypothetical protein VGE27_12035 [Gemmatimonas sp.]|uniref:hypothetical protein n=1 Tax=Gemmatimonas sp. TaxID=1962908 RepID=UPI002ED8DC65
MMTAGASGIQARRHVVLCTGVSSYHVLSYLSNDLARAFVDAGWSAEVLDLSRVSTPTELRRIVVQNRTAFFCGYSGYGANIAGANGTSAYDALGVPYVGLMLDSPSYYPSRHETLSAETIFLHGDDGHHDASVAISPAGSHRGLFRLATSPWTAPTSPIAERTRTVLFASKGGDPVQYEAMLRRTLDARGLRVVLAIADALGATTTPQRMGDVANACLPTTAPDARWHTLAAHGDHLARIRRATGVARALLSLPVTFVGGEWEHLDRTTSRATFLPGTPLPDVRRLMASSASVLNVQPGTTDSVHDRFLLGLQAGAAVVSDSNRFIDARIGREQFTCWDGDTRTIADVVASTLDTITSPEAQTRADRGTVCARERFSLDMLVRHLGAVVSAHRDGRALPHPDGAEGQAAALTNAVAPGAVADQAA